MIIDKIKAAAIHAFVTVVVAAITAGLVYWIWYPGEFARMLGGTELYLLVLGVELCLGPLMSLVIYNPNKTLKELTRDYLCVVLIQLFALTYGVYTVALSRPVFLVFVKDRIEVVVAAELQAEDVVAAKDVDFRRLSWLGPKLVCTESPSDPQEKSNLLISALKGKDIQLWPVYYRSCLDGEVYGKAKTAEQLFSLTNIKNQDLPESLQLDPAFKWLPVVSRFNSWTAVFVGDDLDDVLYLEEDPFM